MATRVGRGQIQLAVFDGPFLKTPPTDAKNLTSQVVANFVAVATGVGQGKCDWQHLMAHP